MTTPESGIVKVSELFFTFNVRQKRDPEREQMFAERYKKGEDVPPIDVYNGTTEIDDGRTRFGGMKLAGVKEIKVNFVPKSRDLAAQIVGSFAKNAGGAKPPHESDAIGMVYNLLKQNVSTRKVMSAFEEKVGQFYFPSTVRRFIRSASTKLTRERIAEATAAVIGEKMKTSEAEEHFSLKKGTLGRKLGSKLRSGVLEEAKEEMTKRSQANTRKNNTIISHFLADLEDGKVGAAAVRELLAHARNLNAGSARSIDKLEAKFVELGGSVKSAPRKRKVRSDKGKKRGSYRKLNGGTTHASI